MAVRFNIFDSLYTAKLGMNAGQAGLSVTGQNVANVNTDGYTRRQLILAPRRGLPFGGGVTIEGVKRYSDQFATSRLIEEENLLGNAKQRAEILTHVSDLFNDLDDTGIGATLDNFFGAWRVLESNPTDATARQEILARGEELCNTFNRVSNEIETVRQNTDSLLRAAVTEINVRTEEIAKLNDQIVMDVVQEVDISDLLDQRDQLVIEIAEYVDVTAIENDAQQITLFMEGGTPLVDGKNQSLLRVPTSAAPGAAPIEYVAINGQVSDVTSIIEGGAIGGVLEVRDTLLPSFATDLDQVAYDLATAVNTQHALGVGMDGLGGRDFFVTIGAPAGAANVIALNAAVVGDPDAVAAALNAASLPGDNRNALAIADLPDQNLAGGGTQTFNEAYSTLVGEVGVATRRANDESSMRQTAIEHVKTIRDSAAGVSLDEEMTNLIQYQRAYQASARVLSVIDNMIENIIQLR
ncbi:MAG: flagellar hook-associated protein FlgK [Deltaproteobacteria bacterium]|nr:flagellar hook-associated protein FlgK [Deltaproteobacteria bacterium]